MNKTSCLECKVGQLEEKRGDYETQYVDREEKTQRLIVPGLSWLECDNCGEVILDDEAMSAIEAARRKGLGLLTPQEIRALRVHLNRTQAAMSDLLGIGEKTYCRWESGAYMQSEGFDRYLRLLILEPKNIQLLEEISAAKTQPPDATGGEETVTDMFAYLTDLPVLLQRAQLFTELISQGSLHMQ